MTSFVALLRGINVGGKRMLPMKKLTRLFTKAGATNVQTYLQSGNVVFEAKAAASIVERARAAIEKQFGFDVPMVVRSGEAPGRRRFEPVRRRRARARGVPRRLADGCTGEGARPEPFAR